MPERFLLAYKSCEHHIWVLADDAFNNRCPSIIFPFGIAFGEVLYQTK